MTDERQAGPRSLKGIPELPPRAGPRGIDAYCHVCWEDVYRLWVAPEPPDYDRCPLGPYTAQTCPNAVAGATRAKLNQVVEDRALELWREREMTLPAFTRRMNPNDIDRASGAWALIRKAAFLDVMKGVAPANASTADDRASCGATPGNSGISQNV